MKIITIPIIILDYLVKKKCGWWLWKLSAVFIFVSFIRELLIFSLFLFGIFFMYWSYWYKSIIFVRVVVFAFSNWKETQWANDKVFVKINIAEL